MISWLEIMEGEYRSDGNSKARMMFDFYERNWKPRIITIIREKRQKGIYYEVWIDLMDYFIPDNYEKLRQLEFDEAAEMCFNYMIEREQKCYS